MIISAYELNQLPKLAAAVISGAYSQAGLSGRIVSILLTHLRERDQTTDGYDTFLAEHGYTWVSGADPLDDVHADLDHDDVLMTPEWTPITVDRALRAICHARWPHLFDAAHLDVQAIVKTAEQIRQ